MKRESWKNRATFIFAAIGSAVGLGNALRFPGLAAKYGGGAFILVYVLAMIVLGWPLLMMEITIGRKMRRGAPEALYGMNKKSEFIGWSAVLNSFVIACYYAVILAWVMYMIIKAFKMGSLPPLEAGNIFYNEVINLTDIQAKGAFDIPLGMLFSVILAWVIMFLCIRKGAHSVGNIVKYTVIIPVVLLLALAVNGIIKDFSVSGGEGLKTMFLPDFSAVVARGELINLIISAFGQVFYSLSVMMAIMIAYGSFVDGKSDVLKDSAYIALGDLLISLLSGVVLFTTLSGTGMLKDYLLNPSGGIGTAFVIYPQALVSITNNGIINSLFAVLFYITLFTLAIDSAFSIIEGVATAIADKLHTNKRATTLACCLIAGICSLIFATKCGLYLLDIVDNWCNNFSLVLIGVLECFAVGFLFNVKKIRYEINLTCKPIKIGKKEVYFRVGAWYDFLIKYLCPLILLFFFVWNFVSMIMSYNNGGGYENYPLIAQLIGGWLIFALVFILAILIQLISRKSKKMKEFDGYIKSWDDITLTGSAEHVSQNNNNEQEIK